MIAQNWNIKMRILQMNPRSQCTDFFSFCWGPLSRSGRVAPDGGEGAEFSVPAGSPNVGGALHPAPRVLLLLVPLNQRRVFPQRPLRVPLRAHFLLKLFKTSKTTITSGRKMLKLTRQFNSHQDVDFSSSNCCRKICCQ